jgi:hypothetical protein
VVAQALSRTRVKKRAMKTRTAWTLAAMAAGLFVFIVLFERHTHRTGEPPPIAKVLPQFRAAAVTSIQIRSTGEMEIRADRTNGTWQLTKPILYPAQTASIDALLLALENLAGQAHVGAQELKGRPNPDKEFGFESPQFSLVVHHGDYRSQILIGARTPLQDQVFLQVVGTVGIFLVDADLLKLLPNRVTQWRDTHLLNLKGLAFDRVAVTGGARTFELQRDTTTPAGAEWRMTRPMLAHADNPRIEDLLQKLQSLHISQFVSDDPKADLDSFGLQPPALELAFSKSTNILAVLQFGKSPTNDTSQTFARQRDQNAIVLVSEEPLTPWRARYDDFRDRRLVILAHGLVDEIEVRAAEEFKLQRLTNQNWIVAGRWTLPADIDLVNQLIGALGALKVVEFVKDVVTPLDLATYGLDPEARHFILKASPPQKEPGLTDKVIAQLDFGSVQGDKVFTRRADENSIDKNSVFAVKLADYQRLPAASWQLRDRRIWNFTENDVTRLIIRQNGKVRELQRTGMNQWAFAAGSQGIINEFAVEETVHRLGELTAVAWVAHGDQQRTRYGFSENSFRITFETKQSGKLDLEFGDVAASGFPCASVVLDGQSWIFEFPWPLYQFVQSYLTIPTKAP